MCSTLLQSALPKLEASLPGLEEKPTASGVCGNGKAEIEFHIVVMGNGRFSCLRTKRSGCKNMASAAFRSKGK
ncbi:hypothetical protein BaRGS_00000124, partial [Batillaria attramentaria]